MAPATGNPGAPSTAVAAVPGAANAGAQTATAIDMKQFADAPVFSVADVLRESPGVSLKQGNGPRDMGISIRGSNARNGFGIRNIVILEDGFPVTQPDGLSRSDLIDPHAYSGIDVWRGPSSALLIVVDDRNINQPTGTTSAIGDYLSYNISTGRRPKL